MQELPVINYVAFDQARKVAKEKKKRELRGGGDQAHEEGGEEELDFEEDEPIEAPSVEPTESAGNQKIWASPKRRFRRKASVDSMGSMRTASSETLAPEAEASSPLQPKNLFGTPPSGGKQATLGRFFSPQSGDRKMSLVTDEVLPVRKRPKMEDAVKALIASGQIMLDGKPLELREDNAQHVKSALNEKRKESLGGRPPKLIGRRGVAGGLKSNVRLKDQKRLRDELPVSTKHSMCTRMLQSRDEFATAEDFWSHWGKQFRMRRHVLKKMYEKRSAWKDVVEKHQQSLAAESRAGRGAKHGRHGAGITRHERLRAAGGGRSKEFPLVYERVVAWFQSERAHGHTVLQRHLSWKYHVYMKEEIQRLQDEICKPDQSEKDIRILKQQLDKAKKQDQALAKSSRNRDKRGRQLVKWMGARIRKPNLETQLSAVEQQVRAELSWHYFDWRLHRMTSGDEAELKKIFSKPAEAMRSMKQAVMRCSDQVPIWIKKPSAREVFGEWEIRTSGRKIEVIRKKLDEQLSKKAQKKGIKKAEEKDEPVEQKDAQIVEHQQEEEEDEAWHLANPLEEEEGKDHTTTMREANCDKYRITFEAHQMITGFFDPDATPSGHCMQGIIIVMGCNYSS